MPLELLIVAHQRGMHGRGGDVRRIRQGGLRQLRIDALQRGQQPLLQDHIVIARPLRSRAIGGDVRAMRIAPARVLEPRDGELLELVFSDQIRNEGLSQELITANCKMSKAPENHRSANYLEVGWFVQLPNLSPFLQIAT